MSFRIVVATATLAGLAALAPQGRAQTFISGAQLAKACSSRAPADENACNGYLAGTLDQVAANAELKATICPPAGTKLMVLREAMAKFARERPDETRGSGIALVQAMIKTNYPCPAK